MTLSSTSLAAWESVYLDSDDTLDITMCFPRMLFKDVTALSISPGIVKEGELASQLEFSEDYPLELKHYDYDEVTYVDIEPFEIWTAGNIDFAGLDSMGTGQISSNQKYYQIQDDIEKGGLGFEGWVSLQLGNTQCEAYNPSVGKINVYGKFSRMRLIPRFYDTPEGGYLLQADGTTYLTLKSVDDQRKSIHMLDRRSDVNLQYQYNASESPRRNLRSPTKTRMRRR